MRRLLIAFFLLAVAEISAIAGDTVITTNSYGPIQLYTSASDAYDMLRTIQKKGVARPHKNISDEECSNYVPWKGLVFMTQFGTVVRISTTERNVVTPSGIRVGDPIEKVRSTFNGRHKEYEQRYSVNWDRDRTIVVFSRDRESAMRFDASEVVEQIFVGGKETVERIEGCS